MFAVGDGVELEVGILEVTRVLAVGGWSERCLGTERCFGT